MEKQPIDDLFSRRLQDAEVAPGSDVFERLQSRLNSTPMPESQPKRRLGGWWYGVAAALVALTFGWIYQSGDKKLRPETALVSTQIELDRQSDKLSAPTPMQEEKMMPTTSALQNGAVDKPEPIASAERARRRIQSDQLDATFSRVETVAVQTEVVASIPDRPLATDGQIAKATTNAISSGEQKNVGRTIVMIIGEPDQNQVAEVPSGKTEITASGPNLGQLFAKVKQLKSGEAFARAAPATSSPDSRTGLKRFVNGVRESLRNENTLEL